MSALSVFLSEVRPFAPGVPDVVAFKYIRQAAIDFCERTRLWKYEDTYEFAADDGCIYTPSGSVLHDIESVFFNGKQLMPAAPSDLDRWSQGWREPVTDAGTGQPNYYTQVENNAIRLVPPMDGTVYLCLRLKPAQDAQDLPEFIAREYRELIGWGALGRVLMQPNQPYTSPDMAAYYQGLFTTKLDRLNTKGSLGQQNAPKRTRPRYF